MPHVLIVDDSAKSREEVLKALRTLPKEVVHSEDWSFTVSENPKDAMDIIRNGALRVSERVDILLADRKFPGSPNAGIQLIEDARVADANVIGILYTAKEGLTEAIRTQALERGAFDVVRKEEGSARQLVLRFRSAMRQRALERQLGILSRYFDPRVFELIQRKPELLSLRKRLVTIGFWDIRKFSVLCERLIARPESVVGFLDEYFERAARVIFDHNGVLDKFIGDGVMAIFGALEDKKDQGEQDALDAVRAAVALRSEFNQLMAHWLPVWKGETSEKIPDELGLGCGLHTHEVLVGNVGTSFRDQFTALGRDVNRASRMESPTAAGQILLSQTTNQKVRDHVNTTQFDDVVGKKDESLQIAYLFESFKI